MVYYRLAVLSLFTIVDALTTKFQAAHSSNTTLFCDYPHFKMTVTPWQIYWILPNETVIQPRFAGDTKYHVGRPPAYDLTIMNINHVDFGWFYCVILWDNYHYLVDSVKVGLNVDGALYDELSEKYRQSALTGGLAAGSVFIILFLSCLIWHYRYGKRESKTVVKEAVYDFDKASKSFETTTDRTETDTEIEKVDKVISEAEEIREVIFIRDKLETSIEATDSKIILVENKDYVAVDPEDIDKIALEEMYQRNDGDDKLDTGLTAF